MCETASRCHVMCASVCLEGASTGSQHLFASKHSCHADTEAFHISGQCLQLKKCITKTQAQSDIIL